MPTAKRKPKSSKTMEPLPAAAAKEESPVKQAARAFGVDFEQLLAYKIYPHGKVVLIAANGMKFVYEAHDGPEPG